MTYDTKQSCRIPEKTVASDDPDFSPAADDGTGQCLRRIYAGFCQSGRSLGSIPRRTDPVRIFPVLVCHYCRRFHFRRTVLGDPQQACRGKDTGHRAGILRSAVPAVYHWCNVLSGTADAGICIGSCADRRRCGISAGSGRFLSAAQCFADLPVHSEELRQRHSECGHQFCFRSHQYHSECSFYFRYRLFPENGYRRCCHCNSYRQGH